MKIILSLIFVLALAIRFLDFPENVNFSYDQARDSFATLEILKGDLKIIGPPTTASDKIFHGVLFYYILAPIYFITGGNPEAAAIFLRILNAAGVFLVFYIAKIIFNKEAGIIGAFLFAISYEESQYAIFFGHPSPGAISVLIFYLGLSLWIFKEKAYGLIVALIGLGLTIQFEDVNALLIFNLILFLLIFKRKLKFLNFKIILLGIGGFLVTVSSFILVEIKYKFQTISSIFNVAGSFDTSSSVNIEYIFFVIKRLINDNFFANALIVNLILILILGFFIYLGFKRVRDQSIFLGLWFLGGLLPHFIATKFSYYYSPGASVSLLILASFFMSVFLKKNNILFFLILGLITFSNLNLILNQNNKGVTGDFIIQPGMILGNQKRVLDYIYLETGNEVSAVSSLSIPLNVKTTWDYLFFWYGREEYGKIPVWYGNNADGFYGNLPIIRDRSELPNTQYLILEPPVGIEKSVVDNFLKEEYYFTKVIEEKKFGTIVVQKREKI